MFLIILLDKDAKATKNVGKNGNTSKSESSRNGRRYVIGGCNNDKVLV